MKTLLKCWQRWEYLFERLDAIDAAIAQLKTQGEQIMATLADITAAVAAEKTVEDSVITLLQQLSQMLKDAIAANDPVAMQAVVDQLNANAKTLSDAVVANTPTPPTPAPAPAPTP